MKRILFIFIAVFMFSFANAQDISFGLKAGLNLTNMHSSNSDFNNAVSGRTAFHVGAVAEFAFSDQFSLQPEVLYTSLGSDIDYGSESRVSDTQKSIIGNYLAIPVMVKYYVADGFSLEAGPQIGFLLSAKAKTGSQELDAKDAFESTDFSAVFGAGYKMENGLFFNARYGLGLSNISKEVSDGDWVKNNVFQFSVGFMFN